MSKLSCQTFKQFICQQSGNVSFENSVEITFHLKSLSRIEELPSNEFGKCLAVFDDGKSHIVNFRYGWLDEQWRLYLWIEQQNRIKA